MKKILLGLIVLAAVAGIVFAGYYLRPQQQNVSITPGTEKPGGLPNASTAGGQPPASTSPILLSGGQQFGLISQLPTLDYFVDSANNVLLIQPDGQVAKVADGQTDFLSTSTISNLIRASFSFDGRKVAATFGNQIANQSKIFDTTNSSWQPLTSDARNPAWSPNSYKIVYLSVSQPANRLAVLDLGSRKPSAQNLLTINQEDLLPEWTYVGKIFLNEPPSAYYQSSLWSFDVGKKTISTVVGEKYGLETKWNPAANEGIQFSGSRNNEGGTSALIDNGGQIVHQLNSLILPSKCVFQTTAAASSSTTGGRLLYCAIPRDIQKLTNSPLPDAYEQKSVLTSDDFFRINLDNGQMSSVFSPAGQSLDATDLKIFNQKLFFINRLDQKLYAIAIQ